LTAGHGGTNVHGNVFSASPRPRTRLTPPPLHHIRPDFALLFTTDSTLFRFNSRANRAGLETPTWPLPKTGAVSGPFPDAAASTTPCPAGPSTFAPETATLSGGRASKIGFFNFNHL
ncbi:hypothetical protein TYRP_019706, partial [Tyrophagus putrescentiae]